MISFNSDWQTPMLSRDEQAFKKAYLDGGKDMLENSMSFAQYTSNVMMGKCVQVETSHYYWEKSQEHRGNTVIEVEKGYSGDEIHMTLHKRYSYPVMHNHAYIEIIYVHSGRCKHFVEEKIFYLNQGDICVLSPNAMHAISVTDDDTIIMNIMVSKHIFDYSFMELLRGGKVIVNFFENLLYKRQLTSPYVIYPTDDDKWVAGITELMFNEVEQQQYAYKRNLSLYTQQLFIYLIRKYEMLARVTTPIDNDFNDNVVAVIGYLSVNYSNASLNFTADFFGYTPNYLGKMLKRYTGKTYSEIISEFQMDNAKKLLDDQTKSITQISHEIGCYDTSHFIRKFKKSFGVSPTEYREQ